MIDNLNTESSSQSWEIIKYNPLLECDLLPSGKTELELGGAQCMYVFIDLNSAFVLSTQPSIVFMSTPHSIIIILSIEHSWCLTNN